MKCRVCGKEIEDGSEFCRYCGAAQKKKRKPTWRERKLERERETAEILKKSHITEQDVMLATPRGTEGLQIKELGDTRKTYIRTALLGALYSLVTVAALAGLVLMIRFTPGSVSRTLIAVICFALLLILAGFGASAADKIYSAGLFKSMSKSARAIKKVSYGKAPYITNEGKLYQLICNAKCIVCDANVHIEEFDGKFYEVCDYDRSHLYALSTAEIFRNLLGVSTEEAAKDVKEGEKENATADASAEDKEGNAYGGADNSVGGGGREDGEKTASAPDGDASGQDGSAQGGKSGADIK